MGAPLLAIMTKSMNLDVEDPDWRKSTSLPFSPLPKLVVLKE
jgi:hypothetical protein